MFSTGSLVKPQMADYCKTLPNNVSEGRPEAFGSYVGRPSQVYRKVAGSVGRKLVYYVYASGAAE